MVAAAETPRRSKKARRAAAPPSSPSMPASSVASRTAVFDIVQDEQKLAQATLSRVSTQPSAEAATRELPLTETSAPNSAQAFAATVPAVEPTGIPLAVAAADEHGGTLEIPLGEITSQQNLLEELEQCDEALPVKNVKKRKREEQIDEQLGPQQLTVEFPFQEQQARQEQAMADTGMIEREMIDTALKQPSEKSITKLGITLIALLVLTAVGFGALLVYQWITKPAPPDSDILRDSVVGRWVSDPYFYSDDETKTYVELLTLNQDGTFILQALVPNNSIPEGYATGDWEVAEEIRGTFDILPETKTISLVYELDGKSVAFLREITQLEQNAMELREYYDDARTDFFDLKMRRVTAA